MPEHGLKDLRDLNRLVFRRFKYTRDEEQFPEDFDRWDQHWYKLINDDKYTIKDDCDGLCATVLEGLLFNEWPRQHLYMALVDTRGGNEVNHAIGLVQLSGRLYVVGDTFGERVVQLKHRPYKCIQYRCMADQMSEIWWGTPGEQT